MCQVHLVPEVDELRRAMTVIMCGECRKPIRKGREYRHIEGPLDDGSGTRYLYRAHEDCYFVATDTVREDGCFTYGGAEVLA